MSELKAYIGPAPDEKGLADYYLKSEADKVIAELKRMDTEHTLQIAKMNGYIHHLEDELRHNKFKRCVAMAKWCKCKRIDAADYRIPRRKWDFYDKWYKRWLEFAEKFKEAK